MDNYLVAVISLPSGVFQPYSGVKTTILILDKKLSKQTDKVLFIKVDNDGYSLGSQRKEIEKNDLPNALELFKSFKNSLINNTELELDKNSLLIEKSKIAEKDDYILNGDRYQINKVQSSKFEIVDINDFKTNKKIVTENKWDKMLYPLDKYDNCNYVHYNIQLSIYGWMLEQFGYKVRNLQITHYIFDEQETPIAKREYKFEYLKEDVENLLEHYVTHKK